MVFCFKNWKKWIAKQVFGRIVDNYSASNVSMNTLSPEPSVRGLIQCYWPTHVYFPFVHIIAILNWPDTGLKFHIFDRLCSFWHIKLCNAEHDIMAYLCFISIKNFTFHHKTEIIPSQIRGRWKRWPCDYSVYKSLLGGFITRIISVSRAVDRVGV